MVHSQVNRPSCQSNRYLILRCQILTRNTCVKEAKPCSTCRQIEAIISFLETKSRQHLAEVEKRWEFGKITSKRSWSDFTSHDKLNLRCIFFIGFDGWCLRIRVFVTSDIGQDALEVGAGNAIHDWVMLNMLSNIRYMKRIYTSRQNTT